MKVAFDIDGTLLIVDRENGRSVADEGLLGVLRWFHGNGDEVFLWSSGGVEYAQEIAAKLNISDLVKIIEKPDFGGHHPDMDLAFDDRETNLAKMNVKVISELGKKCLCNDPTCAKCLLVNCKDDECATHPIKQKEEFRSRYQKK